MCVKLNLANMQIEKLQVMFLGFSVLLTVVYIAFLIYCCKRVRCWRIIHYRTIRCGIISVQFPRNVGVIVVQWFVYNL